MRDTVRCVELAVLNPPVAGEYRVFNQFTEQFSVGQLAELVRDARKEHGLDTKIEHLPNPRTEMERHYYNARHDALLELGLEPHRLATTLIEHLIGEVEAHRNRVKPELIQPRVDWRRGGAGFRTPRKRRIARTGKLELVEETKELAAARA